ncbi:hypothetical protein [Ideonella sp.]|uniref:hypothetical protein n=1 Tax=Ideonella sp. TaxID=1929293 RepID=UPI003BB4B801
MSSVDLVFSGAPATDGALVFNGAGDNRSLARVSVALPALQVSAQARVLGMRIAASLPALQVLIELQPVLGVDLHIAVTLPRLQPAVAAAPAFELPEYVGTRGGLPWAQAGRVGPAITSTWSDAAGLAVAAAASWPGSAPIACGVDSPWQPAELATRVTAQSWRGMDSVRPPALQLAWRKSAAAAAHVDVSWRGMVPLRATPTGATWRGGAAVVRVVGDAWQDGRSASRRAEIVWSDGLASLRFVDEPWQSGDAVVSHGSHLPAVAQPPREPCYTPGGELVFRVPTPANSELVFVCDGHGSGTVRVPIRKVYTVINSITLKLVSSGVYLSPIAFSLSLDADSWTWTWSASLPAAEAALVEIGSDGTAIEVEAIINGAAYRLAHERVSTDRTFGRASVSIGGRGLGAELAVLTGSYSNASGARTAAQLMADVLTVNGVGVGWEVDFGLEDWLVPAGAWAFRGTAIAALQAIAGAAGGYLQPHPTDRVIRVLPKYAIAPWHWDADLVPDIELPTAPVVRESIEWVNKPDYNRVYVSGQSVGVLGQVTRYGTDGSILADMVTDALITTAGAARQRGMAVLGDTGKQAKIRISFPVLPETGLVVPGKSFRYVDGALGRLAVVRAMSLSGALPQLRQTLELEAHA